MRKFTKEDDAWTAVTWRQYSDNVVATGKAMIAAGLEASDTVNILAFNSPEWFFSCIGAINIGSVAAGIYGSNNEDGVKCVVLRRECCVEESPVATYIRFTFRTEYCTLHALLAL